MITINLKLGNNESITRTYSQISIEESRIILDTPMESVNQTVLSFANGVLSSITVTEPKQGISTMPQATTRSAVYATISNKGLVLNFTTYATLSVMLSGISANAEIVKGLKQKPAQQQVVKSAALGKETPEQTQQRLQRALAAKQSKQANTGVGGVDKQKIYNELNKARNPIKSGKELAKIANTKQTELVKCGAIMKGNSEWEELVKYLQGGDFTFDAFDAFSDVLKERDYSTCLTKIRALASRLNIVNGVIHLIK
ncbi:hypothetical protein IAI01_16610 [Vibrio cholerae]|uniref:hypothetical protein n=2 Tax=Vibrio cholerae TaxID=666 RepID=UPI0000F34EDB|nr:hypothetical protein [Vibrio cholerae]ACQ62804.1 hypothetical protein VCD_000844 [Vibrio cholerae MJ-1236]EAZ78707.1 hypothetical protein A5E_A0481 [Vibrio cholerae B33]EEO18424.1 hypothetical protein VCE_000937 [Vibrio cholerae B33]EMB00652.1 Hypothetical protein B839_38020 [Vibrio cholerae O1 str. Inaba G4222]KAA6186837.1 hypothetical protein F2S06_17770 [Vibrio cholerae O1 biovar El Tor]